MIMALVCNIVFMGIGVGWDGIGSTYIFSLFFSFFASFLFSASVQKAEFYLYIRVDPGDDATRFSA